MEGQGQKLVFHYVFLDWRGTIQIPTKNKEEVLHAYVHLKNKHKKPEEKPITEAEVCYQTVKAFKHELKCAHFSNDKEAARKKFQDKYGFAPEEVEELVHNLGHVELYAGAVAGLQRLKAKGVRMSLLRNSGQTTEIFMNFLKTTEVANCFERVYLSDQNGWKKPHRNAFEGPLRDLELTHLPPSSILFVGNDVEKDIKGGNEMGWTTCLICNTEKTSAGLANFELKSFEEVEQLILSHWSSPTSS